MRFTIIDLITLPVLQYRYITLRLSRSSEMSYSHTTLEFIEVSASVKIDLTDELGRRTVSLGASRFFEDRARGQGNKTRWNQPLSPVPPANVMRFDRAVEMNTVAILTRNLEEVPTVLMRVKVPETLTNLGAFGLGIGLCAHPSGIVLLQGNTAFLFGKLIEW